ncbi:hypothetical protein [Arthrobacter sp. H14]|uniref:hypothetical protein n=1 Tax=Arthrobacter sp. H14 TaxID=1312959 RepID=UPI0004AD2B2B|nr:hypothetical protein [Arthrobacter sp. H14]
MNTNKHRTPSGSNSHESAGQASDQKSAGAKMPESEGRKSFDEAVTEHLNQEESDGTAEETVGGEVGRRDNQPALEEQDDDGNPAKTDNE